ncbi:hypothetical protein R3P38DRAFT_3724 [Favolaschia claudopus]|uniref:F-box domain-containing protein n=1 Tax=Favolaschia claudopus TaxID=2862362 RepID=A0AAW0EHQ6_9AGAR
MTVTPFFYPYEPPEHLSTTNNPPSDPEILEIRRIVDKGRVHAAYLQSEILRLRHEINELSNERHSIQSKVDRHAAILSPVRRLPAEILITIFHGTLPSPTSRPAFPTQSPWNVSRVCVLWGSVALSSPELWSHISVHPSRNIPIPALYAQLERSKPRLLSINFSCDGIYANSHALAVLLDNSARWKAVSLLRPPRQTIIRFNNELFQGRLLPELRSLSFKRSDDSETCTAFESAPRLTDVRIDGSHRRVLVPYPQLTRLRVQMPRTPDRLGTALNLTHLTLGKASVTLPPPSYAQPIHLPVLRFLYIADGHYLESFLLPALEDICVRENVSFLPAFITRSPCTLKVLTILEGLLDVVPILQSTPALHELRLRRLFAISLLVPQLVIPDDDSAVVCPELRHLTLCDVEEEEFLLALEILDTRKRAEDFPSLDLLILELDSGGTCPYSVPETYKHLRKDVHWVSGKRAVEAFESWRAVYPGGGK